MKDLERRIEKEQVLRDKLQEQKEQVHQELSSLHISNKLTGFSNQEKQEEIKKLKKQAFENEMQQQIVVDRALRRQQQEAILETSARQMEDKVAAAKIDVEVME